MGKQTADANNYVAFRSAQIPVVCLMIGVSPESCKQVPIEKTPIFLKMMDLQYKKAALENVIKTAKQELIQVNEKIQDVLTSGVI